MREVGGTFLKGPVLHGVGYHVGDRKIQLLATFDRAEQFFVNRFGDAFFHDRQRKNVLAVNVVDRFVGVVQRFG